MKQTTNEKIDALTSAIEKLISKEVAPVLPIAPIAPVAPILPITPQNSGDHDAITKLVVLVAAIDPKLVGLSNDIKALSDGTAGKITGIEKEVEIIKLWKSNLLGKISVITVVTGIVVPIIVVLIAKHFGL